MNFSLLNHGVSVNYRVTVANPSSLSLVPEELGLNMIELVSPLVLDRAHELKEFDVYFLSNPKVKESDIFQVYDQASDSRIGWLIPAISLQSNLHDYALDEHFLRYAYIALRDALGFAAKAGIQFSLDVEEMPELTLSQLFGESVAFLVISRETLGEGRGFDFCRSIPSFARHGFLPLRSEHDSGPNLGIEPQSRVRLYVEQSSSDVGDNEIVASLLRSVGLSHGHEVLRFFYLYQIIELLLERVFGFEQARLVSAIVEAGADSSRVKDALQLMSEAVSEKRRMILLARSYSQVGPGLPGLRAACNTLLVELDRDAGVDLQDFLYPVRNYIFHQFRAFPSGSLEKLEAVTIELLRVLPLLLSTFKKPVAPDLEGQAGAG